MTANRSPQTREEFRDRLAALIREAESKGVNIEGGYEVDSATAVQEWSLELFPVVREERKSERHA